MQRRIEHCMKSVPIRSFSGLHFPALWLNTERYSESLCIQSKCGKIRTRKTPNTDSSRNVGVTSFCSKKAWFFWGCNSCDLTHLRLIFLSYITVWKVSLFRVFLVHIFSHLDLAFRKPHHAFSVFNPNPGKYGREKLRIRTLFTHW